MKVSLHFASLFMMSFELGTETHFFTTLVTLVSTLIFFAVGSHVGVGVAFVLVLVNTMVTIVPTAFSVGFHVSVQVFNALKLLVTTLFWARQFFVNVNKHVLVQSAFKQEAFSTQFIIELQITVTVAMFVK